MQLNFNFDETVLQNFRLYATRYPGDLVRIREIQARSRVLSGGPIFPSKNILQCPSAPLGCHYLGCRDSYYFHGRNLNILRRRVAFYRCSRQHTRAIFCGLCTQMEFNSIDKARCVSCFLRWNSRGRIVPDCNASWT